MYTNTHPYPRAPCPHYKCGGFPADHEVELNAAPTEDKGPLQIRDEKWCRHENYTSEFMLEADIPLDKCKKLNFISHNDRYCQPNGSSCRYRRDHPVQTAARVLAFLLGYDIQGTDHLLLTQKQDGTTMLNLEAEQGMNGIWRALATRKTLFRGVQFSYGKSKPSDTLKPVILIAESCQSGIRRSGHLGNAG